MMRRARFPLVALVLVAAWATACTLILDTESLVTPCTVDQECDDALGEGYACEENACLPIDEIEEGAEGEGE